MIKALEVRHIPPISIPSTILSETFLSTVFATFFTASVADFCAVMEVENARGANVRVLRMKVVRAREAILYEVR